MTTALKPFKIWRDPDGQYFACSTVQRPWQSSSSSTPLGDVQAASASDAVQRYRLTLGDWQIYKHWVLQVYGADRDAPKSFALLRLNGQFIDLLRLRAKQMQQASLVNPFHEGSVMAENFPAISSLTARFTALSQSVKFDNVLEDNPGKWEIAMVGGEYAARFVAHSGGSTSLMPVELFAEMFMLQTASQVQVFGSDYMALFASLDQALERGGDWHSAADRATIDAAASICSEYVVAAEQAQASPSMMA